MSEPRTHGRENGPDDQAPSTVVGWRKYARPRLCARCGHHADDHRLDDSLNLDPTDPSAPFRCIGHMESGRWIDTDCDCPNFVGGADHA